MAMPGRVRDVMCCRSIHGIGWPRRSPDAGDDDQDDDDDDDDRRLACGTVISDKDDQASSCSGQNFLGRARRDHMQSCKRSKPPTAFGAGTHRAVRQANAFCCCPVALNRLCNGGSWKLGDCAHPPPATTVHVAYMLFLPSSSHLNRAEGVFFSCSRVACRCLVAVSQSKRPEHSVALADEDLGGPARNARPVLRHRQ